MNEGVSAIGTRDDAWARVLRIWWLMGAVLVVCGSWLALTKIPDHDIALWINAAERVLAGAELYRDIYEINPPIAFLLTVPPVAVAQALGVEPIVVFQLLVIALALASVRLAQGVARAVVGDRPLIALLSVPLLFALFIAPGKDFGQREHILVLLLLPYFFGTMGSSPAIPLRSRALIGAMAGLGIAFKPFFLVFLIVGEGLVALRAGTLRATLRIEAVAASAVIAAAVAITVWGFPGYLEIIVPLGREIYHGYETTTLSVLLMPTTSGSAVILLCALVLVRAARIRDAFALRLAVTLVAAAMAGFIAYFVQHKGWRYQALPLLLFSTAALGTLCAAALEPYLTSARQWRMALAIGAATVVAMTVSGMHDWIDDEREREADIRPLVALVSSLPEPRRALFLSTHLHYGLSVVPTAAASWPWRYYHLIPLPGLYRDFDIELAGRPFRTPSQMAPTEARFFDTVVTDALRFPPQAIIVDRRYQHANITGFDFFAYFRQDPRFARLSGGYRYVGRIARQDVYVRIP